jgi:hypothetical protein
MLAPRQIGLEVPGRNKSKFTLLKWQCLPLVVAVLRTGCILTRGHPLQVHAGVPGVFLGLFHRSCTAVHGRFRAVEGV